MTEFSVPDMGCNHCVQTITKAVHGIDPTAQVEADLGAKRVRIRSSSTPEVLAAAMDDVGYPAVVRA